jgi:integral membrane protein (TIGR01906 family)
VLFDLNRNVLLISGALLAILLLLRKKFGPYRLGNRAAAWWAGLLALIAPLVIGGLAALDFDRAFVIFHKIFFPGKSNWLFDWRTDPIILALPQEFFRNCAILIGAGLITFSLSLLFFSAARDRKTKTS